MEQQSPVEEEEVQVVEVNNEETCKQEEQSPMYGKEQVVDGDSDDVVPKSNGFLIDITGKTFEDNIIDSSARREPVSVCINSDSDSDSESDTSSPSVSSLSSFSSLEDLRDTEKNTKATRQPKSIKTKGELGIEDLPPVEELTISVPEDDMQKIGKVYSIVDQLVVIESYLNSPPLDLESVLFLSKGKPLGHVFDVFGPVKQPYYLIRFNSNGDIIDKGIATEDSVFYAPSHAEVTNFIFTDELMRQKGSDASWEHNNEPPEEHIDFSDDEKEIAARRKRAAKNRKPTTNEDAVVQKRPNTSFEAKDGRDAATPDISVVFTSYTSKSNNNDRHYGKTSNLSSYSPVNTRPIQRTAQRAEVSTSYDYSKNFAFYRSSSSWPKPPQRIKLQETSFQQNPVPLSPSGYITNRNTMFTPQCRTLVDFSWPTPSHPGMQSHQATSQQSPVPLPSVTPPINQSNFTFSQGLNQNASYRTPGRFSVPPPCHLGLPQGMPPQQVPSQGMLPQQVPPQGILPQQVPSQGMLPQQVPSQGMLPQQVPSQGMLPQQVPSQGMLPQQGPPQGMLSQQGPSQGMLPQQGPSQGMLPQQGPSQGMLPQQGPSQGMLPQQGPPQGMPPQQGPPQGMPPQQGPPQGMPPQQGPPQGMPPQQGSPQGMPPRQGSPQGMPPQQGPPQGMPPQQGPPQGMPPQQGPPQGMPPQQGPPQGMPPQQGPPQGMPPQQGPPQGMPPQQGSPQGMPPRQGLPQGIPPHQGPLQNITLQGTPVHQGPPQRMSPQMFQQSPVAFSSHTFPVNPGGLSPFNGTKRNNAPSCRTPENYCLPVAPNNSYGFLTGNPEKFSSGSSFSSSTVSPFPGGTIAPQWPVPKQLSDQQCTSNQNSLFSRNDQLQSYNKPSTQTGYNQFQMKVPETFSFTDKVHPTFGAPAVLPPSSLSHLQTTTVQTQFSPPRTNFWSM